MPMTRFAFITTIGVLSALGAILPAAAGDFLGQRGTELVLDGKPFYEISFNKFDLYWQILAAETGRSGFGSDPVAAAENSLRSLQSFGFRTIRIFFYDPSGVKSFIDPAQRPKLLAAMDRTLALCDKYDIRVVASLGVVRPDFAKVAGEPFTDQIARKDSKSRGLTEDFARTVVSRYRDRKTIAMWEHGNELLLKADIGGKKREWNGISIPTATEIARFHREMAEFIRGIDPNHLVTTGDSYRTSQWHQNQVCEHGAAGNMWQIDTWEQLSGMVGAAQSGVDVYCIHNYHHGTDAKFTIEPDGRKIPIGFAAWKEAATRLGKPLYVGEWGALAKAKNEANAKFWETNPEWFVSYAGEKEKAARVVSIALDQVVTARVQLTHWWAYESQRDMDQKNPQRMDFTMRETPELVALVADANRRLQMATMGFTYAKIP
jgi:hypothetical protein